MLAVLALGIMAACGDDDDDATTTPAASTGASGTPEASEGPSDMAPDAEQVLRVNLGAEPGTIDPQAMAYTHEASVVQNSYIALFDQDPETSQLTPLAAAELPTTANGGISADGLTHTIKLKSGLKWSDGSALTASDFVYGIIRGYDLNVSGAGYGGFIAGIAGAPEALELDPTSATYLADVNALLAPNVSAVDATTLKIVAVKSSVSFLSNFILPVTAAVQKANVEALGESFGQSAGAPDMITSGPFTITEWVPAGHITMTRNETYTAGHKAYLREVEVNFITDSGQAYSAATGANPSLDQAAIPGAQYAAVKDDPTTYQAQEFGTRFIWVDSTIAPWDKKEFVTAINQATDRETISRDIYFGLRQAWAPLCAGAVYACDPSVFENWEFDLDKAKASALLAYPDGVIPGIILEGVADPVVQNLLVTLQSQWQQIPGVSVELRTVDQATLQADMKGHISGTQISGWGMDFADPSNLWKIFHSDSVGANNLGFYERPAYDALMEQQDTQFDPTERRATLQELQEFLASDPPAITFLVSLRTNYYNEKVKGIVASPFDYDRIGDQFLEDIYIGAE
jgi:ABC-type transport system substrate-binding protein